jgi:ceramide glucosyltransferase
VDPVFQFGDLDFEAGAIRTLVPWVIFALWRWWNLFRYEDNLIQWRAKMEKDKHRELPPAVVWSAVKDIALCYDQNLDRLLNQDYPDYTVVFSIESRDDPAFDFLCSKFGEERGIAEQECRVIPARKLRSQMEAISTGLKEVRIVIAGLSSDEGQKVHNLRAAYSGDGGYGEVIAMADADSLWPVDGLRNLVHSVLPEEVGFSTGYRWLVPLSPTVPNMLASVMNGSVATLLGKSAFRNYAWAGGLAIRRHIFEEYEIAEKWRGRANDDYVVSMELRSDRHPAFCHGLVALNTIDYGWSSFLNFGRRQLIQAWVYARKLWIYAVLIQMSYLGGWAIVFGALAMGVHWAWIPGLLVYGIDMACAGVRRRITRKIFPREACERLHPAYLVDRFMAPITLTIFFLIVLSTAFTWKMTWGGIRYDMRDGKTRILSRKPVPPHKG